MWQWVRFLRSWVPKEKEPLLLNLDETSIRFFYEPRKGLCIRRRKTGPKGQGYVRHATRSQRRKALTHVAIICDDPRLQPELPQILLMSTATVAAKDVSTWRAARGCNVQVWRAKSAWVTNEIFSKMVTCLGKCLKEACPNRQPILLFDAHGVHTSPMVLAEAGRQNIWTAVIPASTTSLLQPLDTDVFARYKIFLRNELHRYMLTTPNEELKPVALLNALQTTIRGVLQRHDWGSIFAKNGSGKPFGVRERLLQQLGWESTPVVPATIPTLEQFQRCFISRREIPFRELLSGLCPTPKTVARRRSTKRPASPQRSEECDWSRRLRPRGREGKWTGPQERREIEQEEAHAKAEDPPTTAAAHPTPAGSSTDGIILASLRRFPPRRSTSKADCTTEAAEVGPSQKHS